MASSTNVRLRTSALLAAAALTVGAGATALWIGGRDGDPSRPTIPSSAPGGSPNATPAGSTPDLEYSTDVFLQGAAAGPIWTLDTEGAESAMDAGMLVDVTPVLTVTDDIQVQALTPDGTVIVTASSQKSVEIEQVSVGTLAPDGTLDPFTAASAAGGDPGPARQSEFVASTATHVAWVETPSTDLQFDNWSVFAADIATGKSVALGSSRDVLPDDTLPIIGPYISVTAGPDMAWWGTPYPKGEKGPDGHYRDFGLKVVARALDGSGELETVADGAILPSASGGDCVVIARVHGTDPSVEEGTYVIAEICGAGPETRLATGSLGAQGSLSALAAGDRTIAWAMWDAKDGMATRVDVIVLDRETGTTSAVTLSPPRDRLFEVVPQLAVGNGIVQWRTQSTSTVFDLETHQLWSLPGERGLALILQCGDWIGWRTLDESGAYQTVIAKWNS